MNPSVGIDQRHALVLLVRAILDQFREIDSLRSRGANAEVSRYVLKEMCAVLRELPNPLQEAYFDILASSTLNAAPRTQSIHVDESFAAYSKDARLRLVREVRERLQAAA